MAESRLDKLISNEKELFHIIDFCSDAVNTLGSKYTVKDYGMNSSRGPEVQSYLNGYHGFDIDLYHGFEGAYGEWDKLKLSYKGRTVLDIKYSGPDTRDRYEYKILSASDRGRWRKAIKKLTLNAD